MAYKLTAFVLAIVMTVGMLPLEVFAAGNNSMTMRIQDVSAVPGSTVTVKIGLEYNPGIAAINIKVSFPDYLVLTDVSINKGLEGQAEISQKRTSPITLAWFNGTANFTGTKADFATLRFTVADNAPTQTTGKIVVSYDPNNIYNIAEENIALNVVGGNVKVLKCVPGDINGDGTTNMKDVTRMFQYFADWEVAVNEAAMDTNGDGSINMKDLTRLFQYLADWDVELHCLCGGNVAQKCDHVMEGTPFNSATCTEDGNVAYWHCSKCNRYFADANGISEISYDNTIVKALGHDPVIIPAVEPTYTKPGYTEGSKCSRCGIVFTAQEKIDPLKGTEYIISYEKFDNDPYLMNMDIDNSKNPNKYISEEGIDEIYPLEDMAGYAFQGWYNGSGKLVTSIPAGTKGNITLYAKWKTEKKYTVHFISEGLPIAVETDGAQMTTVTRKINETYIVPEAKMPGYIFLGWTDKEGNIVKSINPGSYGDIYLCANWTSMRNQTRPVKTLGKPVIYEDDELGIITFTYHIGDIINVPFDVVENYINVMEGGLTWKDTWTTMSKISETQAHVIADTVSDATTRSSSWTLSDEWLQTAGTELGHEEGVSREDYESILNRIENGEKLNISSSNGGSFAFTKNEGSSSDSQITNVSGKVEVSDFHNDGYQDDATANHFEVGAYQKMTNSTTVEASVSAKIPGTPISASTGVKNTTGFEVGGNLGYSRDWSTKSGSSWSTDFHEENTSGTKVFDSQQNFLNTTATSTSTWNNSKGYEKSSNFTKEGTLSSAVSKVISDKLKYSSENTEKTGKTETQSSTGTTTNSRNYTNTVEYSVDEDTIKSLEVSSSSAAQGYYRAVIAGTVHVFAVVSYDIATGTYFVSTYSKTDEKSKKKYFDYSKDDPNFMDRENGVLPFEVPYEVHEIVSSLTRRTEGLQIDPYTGHVTGYFGNSEAVIIPDYYSVDNLDGTYTAIKITGIDPEVFSNKTYIKAIKLGRYITKILDGSFSGCSSLECVVASSVNSIGNNAFNGCTSLESFKVTHSITELGANAFAGAKDITVYAANDKVAFAAMSSGAKRITLYTGGMAMTGITDTPNPIVLNIPYGTDYFALYGGRTTTLSNVRIVANVPEVIINGVNFNTFGGNVLDLHSDRITLVDTNINTDSIAITIPNNAIIGLQGTSNVNTTSNTAIAAKNVRFENMNPSIYSVLMLNGNLVCTSFTESQTTLVKFTRGALMLVDDDGFESTISTITVKFDVNMPGATISTPSKLFNRDVPYGELPIPEMENYTFAGWYTDPLAGDLITPQTICTGIDNITLYAHWAENAFGISFDSNGGDAQAPIVAYVGKPIGNLPIPMKDYHTFIGWYTAPEGGELITADSVFNIASDVMLYAQWEIKPVSDWVSASEVPEGAEIISQKWTYTLTESMESRNSTESGWNRTGDYWRETGRASQYYASFPSGYDTGNTYYKTFAKSPYTAYDNGDTKRVVSNSWTGYIYWHWMYNVPYSSTLERAISSKRGTFGGLAYVYFSAFTCSVDCPYLSKLYCNSQSVPSYNCTGYVPNPKSSPTNGVGTPRYFRFDYYTSNYVDYERVYQYQKITDNLESMQEVYNGGEISNVMAFVRYREK